MHNYTLTAFTKKTLETNLHSNPQPVDSTRMPPVSPADIERCIAHGTRTSVACTRDQRGECKWKHKYMLDGLHVVVEPCTQPPQVLDAYRLVHAWF